ncbi:MAG: nuclear transport factor 2 family protein [Comamonadaceae bacterium]|nr:MAG: nuclear transport factor 2 family protein [Comamonadaceae bacterium]
MSNDDYSPARLADRAMIQDLILKWCRAADRLDYDGMLAVFHPGATDSHGPYIGPIEGLVDWVRSVTPASISSHLVGNMLVEFTGADEALVETYVRTIQQYPPEAKAKLAQLTGGASGNAASTSDMFTSSRYLDRVTREGGVWRISQRTLIQDWKQISEVTVNALQPKEGWVVGRRDGKDEVQRMRAELGIAAPKPNIREAT